jgi:pimeloyl-ACP methyl ester carboxylesterase
MATFILIAGAWHSAWCWERLTPLLKAVGHHVVTPDLIGMGDEPAPVADMTVAAWADQVAEITRAEPQPVILVGHSRAGIVISEAAERAPDAIAMLVYVAAFLLPDGVKVGEAAARAGGDLSPVLDIHGDGTSTFKSAYIGPLLYNLTDEDWVERAIDQVTHEPKSSFATPLALTDANFGRVPRAYIECLQDNVVSIEHQRAMQAQLPCDPVMTLDSDHCPHFSRPHELAAELLIIADQVAKSQHTAD